MCWGNVDRGRFKICLYHGRYLQELRLFYGLNAVNVCNSWVKDNCIVEYRPCYIWRLISNHPCQAIKPLNAKLLRMCACVQHELRLGMHESFKVLVTNRQQRQTCPPIAIRWHHSLATYFTPIHWTSTLDATNWCIQSTSRRSAFHTP